MKKRLIKPITERGVYKPQIADQVVVSDEVAKQLNNLETIDNVIFHKNIWYAFKDKTEFTKFKDEYQLVQDIDYVFSQNNLPFGHHESATHDSIIENFIKQSDLPNIQSTIKLPDSILTKNSNDGMSANGLFEVNNTGRYISNGFNSTSQDIGYNLERNIGYTLNLNGNVKQTKIISSYNKAFYVMFLKDIIKKSVIKGSEGKTYVGVLPVNVDNNTNKISLQEEFVNKVNTNTTEITTLKEKDIQLENAINTNTNDIAEIKNYAENIEYNKGQIYAFKDLDSWNEIKTLYKIQDEDFEIVNGILKGTDGSVFELGGSNTITINNVPFKEYTAQFLCNYMRSYGKSSPVVDKGANTTIEKVVFNTGADIQNTSGATGTNYILKWNYGSQTQQDLDIQHQKIIYILFKKNITKLGLSKTVEENNNTKTINITETPTLMPYTIENKLVYKKLIKTTITGIDTSTIPIISKSIMLIENGKVISVSGYFITNGGDTINLDNIKTQTKKNENLTLMNVIENGDYYIIVEYIEE